MEQQFKAILKNTRISARKARLVVDMVRGKPVSVALDTLKLTNRKAAPLVSKLIQSAMANATSSATVDVDRLVVSEVFVDEGATLKRYLPRAQGRATPIRKRSSHITVKLAEL
ncbi:50S ribosomal protein L22 [Pseudobacteriovorax antillogorgiicola]|uniref:Large ribosomal subunit protein uL22 n=1 Tax=Pseudobacteriovorax antillogorgiicola TaxID=1513793 RepID=A0A1Y6B7X1_9BACT|nr:50S ribosomal protein L22 [Pseudobacteriovorax antillogorgiicola]TCS59367.1 LSU ribosomal protein L22P [Pseudobacteriovorax antillogorgiicola]SME88952.1 LSU ribosomal protein L22P [Pseudobacteriovorax antillogorgiicola]